MSVESVNNSGNNTGLYTTGAAVAAVVGSALGAAAGDLMKQKSFLKYGVPTDSFIKRIGKNLGETRIEELMSSSEKQMCDYAKKNIEKLKNIKNKEQLINFINEDYAVIVDSKILKSQLDLLEKLGFERMKELLIATEESRVYDAKRSKIIKLFIASWDKNKKQFVHNKEIITKECFDAVKNAANSIHGKYSMIYSVIGAAALGLGTYFAMVKNIITVNENQKI